MDHLAVTTDDFDALLDASSLGAPHVLAETEPIPPAIRCRMAQAVDQQRTRPETCSEPKTAQASEQARPGRIPKESTAVARDLLDVRGTNLVLVVSQSQYEDTVRSLTPPGFRPRRAARPRLYSDGGEHSLAAALREFHRSRSSSYLVLTEHVATAERGRWEAEDLWTHCIRGFVRTSLPPYLLRDPLTTWHIPRTGGGLHQLAEILGEWQLAPGSWGPGAGRWSTGGELLRYALAGQSRINLQAYLQPVHFSRQDAMGDPVTNLLVRRIAPPHFHVARLAPSAYARTASGLHLSADIAAPLSLRDCVVPTKPPAVRTATPTVLARKQRRARQWTTTVDGIRTQHAVVPMRIHPEEHEALTQPLRTRFTYRVSDPYAVEARFRVGTRDETVWTFSRDLLKDGLQKEAGLGDVIVWPEKEPRQQARVFIRLTSPEGKALLSAAEHDVRAFVEAAGRLVPYGLEHSYLQPMIDSFEATVGELARPGGRD
ncbi:SsgA family sporulation/cell division regulator [Streptomyces collinus]|uniref:SsgA family sporulation/cell division regulator n=1 Tax=Streptomyces collinus TaxID=42684 RepID=UPI003673AF94